MADEQADDQEDYPDGNFTSSNLTIDYHTWGPSTIAVVTTLYVVIIVLAIGGNALVCYTVLVFKGMRTVTNYFIVNLAVSDILMAVLCIPFSFVSNIVYTYWPFGSFLCPVVTYSQTVAVFLSCMTLVSIGIDRYIAVIYPLRPRMTDRQAVVIICFIWILSTGISLPVAIQSRLETRLDHMNVPRQYCTEIWQYPHQKYSYGIAILVLQYFFPLSVFIYTYARIGFALWFTKTPGEADPLRDQRITESKKKMIRMMITVVVVYAVCWLPVHAITLIGDVRPEIYNLPGMNFLWVFCHWLSMSNSCCNPIVYYWMNQKYKHGFRYALTCTCLRPHGNHKRDSVDDSYAASRSMTNMTSLRTKSTAIATRTEIDSSSSPHSVRHNGR